jgi:hypothetical protein
MAPARPISDAVVKPSLDFIVLPQGAKQMRYVVAWLLGVPASILVIWFVVSHVL